MVTVKAMQLTDIHEDTGRLAAANKLIDKEGIELVLCTGDWIGTQHGGIGAGRPSCEDELEARLEQIQTSPHGNVIRKLIKKYKIKTEEDLHKITDPTELQQFAEAQKQQSKDIQGLSETIEKAYDSLRPELEKMASKAKIIGVAGNHDTQHAYQKLGDLIDFADINNAVSFKGLKIKGTTNTWELPTVYNNPIMQQTLGHTYINYELGETKERAKDNPEALKQLSALQAKELKRLGDGGADVFLTHKPPGIKDSGEAADEYMKNCGITAGGHFHSGSIYTHNGKPCFNPGTNHFFVYEFDKDKKVKKVQIHKIYYN